MGIRYIAVPEGLKKVNIKRMRVPVEIDHNTENLYKVKVEAVSAYYVVPEDSPDDDYCAGEPEIHIIGELVAMSGKKLNSDREIQAVCYNENGDVLGRDTAYFHTFGLRRSFSLEITNEDPTSNPAKVKLFIVHEP